jgi:hypothetical protein
MEEMKEAITEMATNPATGEIDLSIVEQIINCAKGIKRGCNGQAQGRESRKRQRTDDNAQQLDVKVAACLADLEHASFVSNADFAEFQEAIQAFVDTPGQQAMNVTKAIDGLSNKELVDLINSVGTNDTTHGNVVYFVLGAAYERYQAVYKNYLNDHRDDTGLVGSFDNFLKHESSPITFPVSKPMYTAYCSWYAICSWQPSALRINMSFTEMRKKGYLSRGVLLLAIQRFELQHGREFGTTVKVKPACEVDDDIELNKVQRSRLQLSNVEALLDLPN